MTGWLRSNVGSDKEAGEPPQVDGEVSSSEDLQMQKGSGSLTGARDEGLIPSRRIYLVLLLVVLFAMGLVVRLFDIANPPLDFHPTRQYHGVVIAHAMYLETLEDIPEWQREVARLNSEYEPALEPPIMEAMAVLGYSLLGGEYLWIPRVFSIAAWLIGGVFLFLIGRRLFSVDAAFFAVAFYLFLPYGVQASRSFQPDPLMVALILLTILLMLRYYDHPSLLRLMVLSCVAAVALFVKPIAVFVIYTTMLAYSLNQRGFRKGVLNPSLWIFMGLSLLPVLIYYVVSIATSDDFVIQASGTFLPQLVFTELFWSGWFLMIGKTVGYLSLVAALFGLMVVRAGRTRAVLCGLWVGYVLFGLMFGYHVPTHDYYHLQLIPIAALSLSPFGASAMRQIAEVSQKLWWRSTIVIFAVLVAAYIPIQDARWSTNRNQSHLIQVNREIGELVQHSTHTIIMGIDYGTPLRYYGEFFGVFWLGAPNPFLSRVREEPSQNVEDLKELISQTDAEYFIVTNFDAFRSETEVREYLYSHYPVFAETPYYIIFDLQLEADQ